MGIRSILKKIGKAISALFGGLFTLGGLYFLYKMFDGLLFHTDNPIIVYFAVQLGAVGGILTIAGLIILWAVKRW